MSPHPSLSDWSDERRFSELVAQHRSGFAAGTRDAQPSDVAPLDVSRFPDSCAFEGAAPVASYDAGRVIRESEREARGFWWALPVVGLLSILAAWLQFGGPL